MKNDKLLINYKDEVLELFKIHYKRLSTKDQQIEFHSVLKSVLDELQIQEFNDDDVRHLKEWFNNIHYLNFIHNVLPKTCFEEAIFHSNELVQIIQQEQKEKREISGLSLSDYQLSFEMFALKNNIAWNYADPFASFSAVLHGREFRITMIHYSTSANKKSKIFLRSLNLSSPTLDLFNNNDPFLDETLKALVAQKKNILISGGTGSGKTTFLRALLNETEKNEHIVILEDTHEIRSSSPQQTSFLAQESHSKKSLKDYCAYALRMSPDRIIVGEMRSTEVVPFMLAMNTGHKGLMSTIHANSCQDAIARTALLFSLYSGNSDLNFSLITKLVCKNIHYIIHLEDKKIKEISKVLGSEGETSFCERIFEQNSIS